MHMNLTCLKRPAFRMSALAVLLACAVSMAAVAAPEPVAKNAVPVTTEQNPEPVIKKTAPAKRWVSPVPAAKKVVPAPVAKTALPEPVKVKSKDSPATFLSAMDSPSIYRVPLGESRIYRFAQPIKRVAVGDPQVADYIVLNRSEIYLLGKKLGSTNLVVWDQQGNVTSTPVQVSRGTAALQALLKVLFPKENDIHVFSLGPALVLSGTVADPLVAESVARLATASFGGSVSSGNPESALIGTDPKPFTSIISEADNGGSSSVSESRTDKTIIMSGPNSVIGAAGADSTRGVVNLLKVRNSQQVRLEVRIAQVSKNYLDFLGLSAIQNWGNLQGSLNNITSGFVSNATLDLLLGPSNSSGQRQYDIKMLGRHKPMLFRMLAEPTIVTMSGKEGYFLVGGKVYVPTRSETYAYDGIDIVGKAEYIERTYGVGLHFMPTVLDAGRISLKVVSEFSEPNTEPITAGTTTTLASFKVSTVSTTVQMNEGQNLVIGGLTLDNLSTMKDGMPWLSEIPLLGALFRNTQKDNEKIELMVIIRPTLVKASETVPELPTDKVVPPTRAELLLGGKLEGSRKK